MSLLEHVTSTASSAEKLTFDSKNGSTSTLGCRVCLWEFESKAELDIHNYLEHMIITHLEDKRNTEIKFTSWRGTDPIE
jgi:hypothetical protein